MKKKSKKSEPLPLTDEEGEVRILTREDFVGMRPFLEVFPEAAAWVKEQKAKRDAARKPGQRGPGKVPAKQQISIRLDVDILAFYQATGPGWQKRINKDLRSKAKL